MNPGECVKKMVSLNCLVIGDGVKLPVRPNPTAPFAETSVEGRLKILDRAAAAPAERRMGALIAVK